jgi:hypothetical protein
MIVNSQNVEFGYELISAIPYAYYLHTKGKLTETISGIDTDCLYYFSPKHTINPEKRSFYNTPNAAKIPNIDIHKSFLYKEEFAVPNYKEKYKNDRFKFNKPSVIICNRINREWGSDPINFFDLPTLEKLFRLLKKDYQIIYINIYGKEEYYDNETPVNIGDYKFISEKYKDVINIIELHKENRDLTFNELQLMLFANCEKYITMNGGHSILASFFGGQNIIFSKYGNPQARELRAEINSFYRFYHEFSEQRIMHVATSEDLINKVRDVYVKKIPLCNILVRTTQRPNYFATLMKTIANQTYNNIRILVAYQHNSDLEYLIPYPIESYKVNAMPKIEDKPKTDEIGMKFHANEYIADLQQKVTEGFILYIDDDDCLLEKNAISLLAKKMNKKSTVVFFKARIGETVLPPKNNFENKIIEVQKISGISFALSSDIVNFTDWSPYKRADFRTAKKLNENAENVIFYDKLLTATQDELHSGNRQDKQGNAKRYKLPKNRQIHNYLSEKHKEREPKATDNYYVYGKVYKFICMPTGNIGHYEWNRQTQENLKNGRLKEI